MRPTSTKVPTLTIQRMALSLHQPLTRLYHQTSPLSSLNSTLTTLRRRLSRVTRVTTARPGRIKADVAIDLLHPRHHTIKHRT